MINKLFLGIYLLCAAGLPSTSYGSSNDFSRLEAEEKSFCFRSWNPFSTSYSQLTEPATQEQTNNLSKLKYALLLNTVKIFYVTKERIKENRKAEDLNSFIAQLQLEAADFFEFIKEKIDSNNDSLLLETANLDGLLKLANDAKRSLSNEEEITKIEGQLECWADILPMTIGVAACATVALGVLYGFTELGQLGCYGPDQCDPSYTLLNHEDRRGHFCVKKEYAELWRSYDDHHHGESIRLHGENRPSSMPRFLNETTGDPTSNFIPYREPSHERNHTCAMLVGLIPMGPFLIPATITAGIFLYGGVKIIKRKILQKSLDRYQKPDSQMSAGFLEILSLLEKWRNKREKTESILLKAFHQMGLNKGIS